MMIAVERIVQVIKTADFWTLSPLKYCSVPVKMTITPRSFPTKLRVGRQLSTCALIELAILHIQGKVSDQSTIRSVHDQTRFPEAHYRLFGLEHYIFLAIVQVIFDRVLSRLFAASLLHFQPLFASSRARKKSIRKSRTSAGEAEGLGTCGRERWLALSLDQ